jgi:hypothetical protein
MAKRSLWQKIKFLMGKEAFTWDFCLFTKAQHKRYLRAASGKFSNRNTFVLIGHPKSLITAEPLKELIKMARGDRYNCNFKTLTEVYAELSN